MSVPVIRFAYSHSYNNHVKIESISTRQTKLKKILIKQKDVIRIIFYVNEETRARPSFQELNICQINLLKSSCLCKESKVFSSYFKIFNHVHENCFSKHNFKRTRWFPKICKIFDKLSRPEIRELLPYYGRKNLVITIFFEQRIKEKLNTRSDYYFWECCLLYYVFVVLNPHYLHIQ